MRELAQAQTTSSNVLSELGRRLSTGAGTTWASQAGAGNATPGTVPHIALRFHTWYGHELHCLG